MNEYSVTIDGFEVHCDTPAAVLELIRFSKKPSNGGHGPGRPPTRNGYVEEQKKRQKKVKTALAFLRTSLNGNGGGADAEALVRSLKLKAAKGIGGTAAQVNKLLEGLRFNPSSVYASQKLPNEERLWRAGNRLSAAILALENLKGGGQ